MKWVTTTSLLLSPCSQQRQKKRKRYNGSKLTIVVNFRFKQKEEKNGQQQEA